MASRPTLKKRQSVEWLIHHVNLGVALKEKADAINVEAHLQYPGAKPEYESLVDFI